MDLKTFFGLAAAVSSCLPLQPQKEIVPVVVIPPADQVTINVEDLFPLTNQALYSEVLAGLLKDEKSKYDYTSHFEAGQFRIYVHYFDNTQKNKSTMEYFVLDTDSNAMVVLSDIGSNGSLDRWHKCPLRVNGSLYDTRRMFYCEGTGYNPDLPSSFFRRTLKIAHGHIKNGKASIDNDYKDAFASLMKSDFADSFGSIISLPE